MNILTTPTPLASEKTKTLAMWRSSMASAARTTVACAVVATVRYYTPNSLGEFIAFPALSYVVAIIIATDATLGDALHGAACAFWGTIHSIAPAILILWGAGTRHFNMGVVTVAVGLSSFFVALPRSTHVLTKRIALAQIVIVYVAIEGPYIQPVMHPLRVGASAILGSLAAVLALLVPYPRLAHFEVIEKSRIYVDIMSNKLRFFAAAFCTEDSACAAALVSQAKSMAKPSNNLLQKVKRKQESIKWESLRIGSTTSNFISFSQIVQGLDAHERGMDIALTSMPSFPNQLCNDELKALLPDYINKKCQELKQMTYPCITNSSSTVHETAREMPIEFPHFNVSTHLLTQPNLSSFFFLFCLNHFNAAPTPSNIKHPILSNEEATALSHKQKLTTYLKSYIKVSRKNFMVSFKCSLILGLSVLFGMLYSRENGYWAGLTAAFGMVTMREPTYKVSNMKAQGTLLGSVYGVLGCLIPEGLIGIRLLVLIPWFVFTSFIKCSKMYGPIGASSAAIAAILIMGRQSYGPANAFAIMRITELFIALFCTILVELLLQPVRASTLLKAELSDILWSLQESVEMINGNSNGWNEKLRKFRGKFSEMEKLIDEADMEPNFWYQPFPGTCYRRMLGTLVRLVDLLYFAFLTFEPLREQWPENETLDGICTNLNLFKKMISSTIKNFEDIVRVKSLTQLEKKFETANGYGDIESVPKTVITSDFHKSLCSDHQDTLKIISSLLQHGKELMDTADTTPGGEEMKTIMSLPLGGLIFCVEMLFKITREIEKDIKELLESENPSMHINMYNIISKIKYQSV